MYGCQQILLKPSQELKAILEFLCDEANKLTNMGIYYGRQLYLKKHKYIGKYDLEKHYKNNRHYQILYSQAAQQVLRTVSESMKSFYLLKKLHGEGKLEQKPKLPSYRKNGLALVTYPKQALKITKEGIRVPLGKLCKLWFKIDSFILPIPSNIKFEDIKELRILPRNKCFYVEYVYQKQVGTVSLNPDNVLGIDSGVNNWLSCLSNVGTSFIIDGCQIKSFNRWYNKQISTIKENKPQGFWSKKLALITEKRNRQMRDAVNKAARLVVNHCLKHDIGRIVFGWNTGVKQDSNLGKVNNQNFVTIPTARLKERIRNLCESATRCLEISRNT